MEYLEQETDPRAPTPSTDARESELLERVGRRDREALRELYLLYHRRLARFLTRLTRRYDIAEEIINDTMWVVWERAADFRGASRVSTWIIGIAYRRALKTLRRNNSQQRANLADEREDGTDPSDAVGAMEDRQLVLQALARLPLDQRLVLEFTYYLGHSCEDIAAIMECPVSTVKTRMFHARRKLRALLPVMAGAGRELDHG